MHTLDFNDKLCPKYMISCKTSYSGPNALFLQGLHRLEKYFNIQDCLEKSLKIKFALKST